MNPGSWTSGNQIQLLENGEEYFPQVLSAIRDARQEVLLETFIWFEDEVGHALRAALVFAAENGAQVHVLVDGFGSPQFSEDFLNPLIQAGVQLRSFDPQPRFLGLRLNLFRRMHRKIVVIDEQRAFVGGINYSEEHLRQAGAHSKQDYAVEVQGPVVQQIRSYCLPTPAGQRKRRHWHWPRPFRRIKNALTAPGRQALATFLVRDNHAHPQDIEFFYRAAIRSAEHEILIANAYFFPSWRFLRDLRRAAQRGVRVMLLVQGRPDKEYVRYAASSLYDFVLSSGIELYEYTERPFHGKVAVVDRKLATVGSFNLDPLSMALNLEANIAAYDGALAKDLRSKLMQLIHNQSRLIQRNQVPAQRGWKHLLRILAYHIARRFPDWSRRLLRRSQKLAPLGS